MKLQRFILLVAALLVAVVHAEPDNPTFLNPALGYDSVVGAPVFTFDAGSEHFPDVNSFLMLTFPPNKGGLITSKSNYWDEDTLYVSITAAQLRSKVPQRIVLYPFASRDLSAPIVTTLSLEGFPGALPSDLTATFPAKTTFTKTEIAFDIPKSSVIATYSGAPAFFSAPDAPALSLSFQISYVSHLVNYYDISAFTCTIFVGDIAGQPAPCQLFDEPENTASRKWRRAGITLTPEQQAIISSNDIRFELVMPRVEDQYYAGVEPRIGAQHTGYYALPVSAFRVLPKVKHLPSFELDPNDGFGFFKFRYQCRNFANNEPLSFRMHPDVQVPELADFLADGFIKASSSSEPVTVSPDHSDGSVLLSAQCSQSGPQSIDVTFSPPATYSSPVNFIISLEAQAALPTPLVVPLRAQSKLDNPSFSVDSNSFATIGWSGFSIVDRRATPKMSVAIELPFPADSFTAFSGNQFASTSSISGLTLQVDRNDPKRLIFDLSGESAAGSVRFSTQLLAHEKFNIGGELHVEQGELKAWVMGEFTFSLIGKTTFHPMPRTDGVSASYETPFALLTVVPGPAATAASRAGEVVIVTVALSRALGADEFNTAGTTCAIATKTQLCSFTTDPSTDTPQLTVTIPANGLAPVEKTDPISGETTIEPALVTIQLLQLAPTAVPGVQGTVTVAVAGKPDASLVHFSMPAATVPFMSGLKASVDDSDDEESVVLTWDTLPFAFPNFVFLTARTYELGSQTCHLGQGTFSGTLAEGVSATLSPAKDSTAFSAPQGSTGAIVPAGLTSPMYGPVAVRPHSEGLVFMQDPDFITLSAKATPISWTPYESDFSLFTADSGLQRGDDLNEKPLIMALRVDASNSDLEQLSLPPSMMRLTGLTASWSLEMNLDNLVCMVNDGREVWPSQSDLISVTASAADDGKSFTLDLLNSPAAKSRAALLIVLCEGMSLKSHTEARPIGLRESISVSLSMAPISDTATAAPVTFNKGNTAISRGPSHLVLAIANDRESNDAALTTADAESIFPLVLDNAVVPSSATSYVTLVKFAGASVLETVRLRALLPERSLASKTSPLRKFLENVITGDVESMLLSLPTAYYCGGQDCKVKNDNCGYVFDHEKVCTDAGSATGRFDDHMCHFADNKGSIPVLPVFDNCKPRILDLDMRMHSGTVTPPHGKRAVVGVFVDFPPGVYTVSIPRSVASKPPMGIERCKPDAPLTDLRATNELPVCERADNTIQGTFVLNDIAGHLYRREVSLFLPEGYFHDSHNLPAGTLLSTFNVTGPSAYGSKIITGNIVSDGMEVDPPSSKGSKGLKTYIIVIIVVAAVIAAAIIAFIVYKVAAGSRSSSPAPPPTEADTAAAAQAAAEAQALAEKEAAGDIELGMV